MTPRSFNSRHALESCTFQLHAWNPFHHAIEPSKPYPFHAKKPCLSDRSTAPTSTSSDALDLSKLTLHDDPPPPPPQKHRDESFRWIVRKRRRRGSRSVSGRSSDRSGTHRRGGASGAYATCSDFPLAAGGTDSSGELFLNGDGNWASDVSEVRISKRESREGGGLGGPERESSGFGSYQGELPGNESGYGSEPGYRGDAEFGYGDEFDEEEDDGRMLFWGERFGDTDRMEIVDENKFSEQKIHHRCRRKKHD